jgi:hypothetical protein
MENRYYTPEREEVHVGFEYEAKKYKDIWAKYTYGVLDSFLYIQIGLDPLYVRVKYLDKEDIESLGWESFGRDSWMTTFEDLQQGCSFRLSDNNNDKWLLDYNNKDLITIYNYNADIVFTGKIKNKSELKKLMNQLEIK